MASYSDTDYEEPKTAAEIQREIEMQRSRVENTIDQIQERLSPGQIVDELLSYTKTGGAEFASSLGRSAAANPLPVALLGVSLAWLIAGPNKTPSLSGLFGGSKQSSRQPSRSMREYESYDEAYLDDRLDEFDETLADAFDDELEYAFAPVQGSSLRRSYVGTDETSGGRYAEFVDEAGKKFRAATDDVGNRAGHFTDEAGNTFRGFTDAAGNRIKQFRDEAGDLISDAAGWASEKLGQGRRLLHDARDAVSRGASSASSGVASGMASGVSAISGGVSSAGRSAAQAGRSVSQAGASAGRRVYSAGASAGSKVAEVGSNMSNRVAEAGSAVGRQGAQAARKTADVLQEQPLVTGALAFAVGAAIGALLPRTSKEDELLGDAADSVKAEAGRRAGEIYQSGKEQIASLYNEGKERASDAYHQATEKAGEAYERTRSTVAAQAENLSGAASTAASEVASAVRSGGADTQVERDEPTYGDDRNQARGI